MSFWRRKTDKPLRCPILEAPCIEARCAWWQTIKGKDPQSTETIDHGGCAVVWFTTLMVENSQLVNQVVASVQSDRNETVTALHDILSVLNPPGRTVNKPGKQRG
jgi:hypothetical protein